MDLKNTTVAAATHYCALIAAGFTAGISNASTVNVADVTASSQISDSHPGFNRIDDYLINGSGLNLAGEHGTAPDGSMWLSSGTSFGGIDPDPSVLFDLGATYQIDGLHVWNYNETGNLSNRGVNAVTVKYGSTPTPTSTLAGITSFTKAPGAAGYAGETYNAFTPFAARYVLFDIDTNHGGDNNFYGLSEVQFDVSLANTITGVTIEGFSSQLSGFGGRLAVDAINGSGFNESTGVHDTDASSMWVTDGNNGVVESDENENGLPSFITFDLEGNYDLDALAVWNYNEAAAGNTDRGARDVEISVASSEGGAFTSLGVFEFDQAPGTISDFGQMITLEGLAGTDDVRLIRFDITSNWGDSQGLVGLSEVRFSGMVVPEPSSLVLLGLGGLAVARRRRG